MAKWRFMLALFLVSACVNGDRREVACDVPFVLPQMEGIERHTDLFTASDELKPLERLTNDGQSIQPRVSPDGQRVAFVNGGDSAWSRTEGSDQTWVYVMDIDGSAPRQASSGDSDTFPDWSPSGDRLVFQRDGTRLFVLTLDDGSERNLGRGSQPSWSPVDDLIAFVGPDGPEAEEALALWVVRSDGTGRRRLLDWYTGRPLWSPDGSHIAFLEHDDATFEFMIRTLNVATGAVREVPGSQTKVSTPITWTNEGDLLFVRNLRGPDVEIVASQDGTKAPRRIRRASEDLYNLAATDNPACPP